MRDCARSWAAAKLSIVGSVRPTLEMLWERLPARNDATFLDKITADRGKWNNMLDAKADPARTAGNVDPQAIAGAVSDRADDDAIFVTDTGLATLWAANWPRASVRSALPALSTPSRSALAWDWRTGPRGSTGRAGDAAHQRVRFPDAAG